MPVSWIICGILLGVTALLYAKIHMLKKGARELCAELAEHLKTDTNTLISVSSGGRHIKRLAAKLNRQLRLLRNQRRTFLNGNRELKEAVTNVSHDLRTPLTAICGYLELLEREQKSEAAARYLDIIANRTQALKQLTGELFRYSIIISTSENLKLETVNVNSVLEESIAAFYGALTKQGIEPVIHMPEEKVIRTLSKAALARIFDNLLNNALAYSDGDLDISLSDSGEIIFMNTAADLNEIQAGKLFDRFFSVEAARNSTGLGLAISKALVEQLGGTIAARYAGGKLSVCIAFKNEAL